MPLDPPVISAVGLILRSAATKNLSLHRKDGAHGRRPADVMKDPSLRSGWGSRFALFVAFFQGSYDSRIGQRGHVAQRATLGDVAQQAPHDLAAARLREVGGHEDLLRFGDGADLLRDVL